MSKAISVTKMTETLSIALCTDGYWLYDETRGMNLSMGAKTEQAAFVEALEYYQKRLKEVESSYKTLQYKVDNFVKQFINENEYEAE